MNVSVWVCVRVCVRVRSCEGSLFIRCCVCVLVQLNLTTGDRIHTAECLVMFSDGTV